jgi:hypothetical protein
VMFISQQLDSNRFHSSNDIEQLTDYPNKPYESSSYASRSWGLIASFRKG